jgi:hypothetical protein
MSHPNNPIGTCNIGIGSSTHLDYRIGKVQEFFQFETTSRCLSSYLNNYPLLSLTKLGLTTRTSQLYIYTCFHEPFPRYHTLFNQTLNTSMQPEGQSYCAKNFIIDDRGRPTAAAESI